MQFFTSAQIGCVDISYICAKIKKKRQLCLQTRML